MEPNSDYLYQESQLLLTTCLALRGSQSYNSAMMKLMSGEQSIEILDIVSISIYGNLDELYHNILKQGENFTTIGLYSSKLILGKN